MGFLKILTGPISGLVKEVGGVIDSLSTTSEEKLDAQRKILEIQSAFQVKVMELEGDFAKTQASVVIAEANSQSWLARNWRPLFMLVLIYIIFHNYVLAPMFSITAVDIVPDMWALMKLGMGGYIGGRTVEKVTPQIVDAIKEVKKK